jgi:hypothetical protein
VISVKKGAQVKHKIYYDKQNDIVREEFIGSFSEEDVPEYFARTREVLAGIKHRRVLVDFSQAARKLYDSRKVRQMLIKGTAELEFTDEKVAILVADPVKKMMSKAMTSGSVTKGKKVEVEYFTDEAEAIAWLLK